MTFRKTVSILLISALTLTGLAGCQTMNQHRTATGAVLGAALGAGAGALIDKDNRYRGALIGTAAGGLLGAGIGHVLQKQKEAFDRIEDLEVQQQTVVLQPPPQYSSNYQGQPAPPPQQATQQQALMLRLTSDVLFEQGSSALKAAGVQKVREIAEILKQYPDSDVYVRGYTSSDGDDRTNYELSQRRAEVVSSELIAAGVDPIRIFTQGMGESNPIASNDTEQGRMQNRRVEMHVVPRSAS